MGAGVWGWWSAGSSSESVPRSLLIIGFGELVVLGVVGLVGACGVVFWVG